MTELMKRYEAETGESFLQAMEFDKVSYYIACYKAWLEVKYHILERKNAKLKSQLTWRPVSEGLPEIGQRVLYLGNDIDIGEYNGYGEWIDTDGGVLPIQRTTHWLPIPPAPEGEKE